MTGVARAAGEELERDMSADHSQNQEAFRCEYDTIRSVALALKDDSEAALSIAQDCLGRSVDPWTANVGTQGSQTVSVA